MKALSPKERVLGALLDKGIDARPVRVSMLDIKRMATLIQAMKGG